MNPSKNNLSARQMIVNCSGCRTPLKLPSGVRSIRCALCKAVTHIVASTPRIQAPPSGKLPHPHGKKRALICGISYLNTRFQIQGCINDAKCMRYLLINNFKFSPDSIIMLTEEATDPTRIPTMENMKMGLFWLVHGCTAGDSLFFYFSGHGSQQRNINGDEIDGYNETLCPLDFSSEGMLPDDAINSIIVRPLPHGAKLHSISDACRSGTVMDLPYLCRMNKAGGTVWEDHRPRSGLWKGTAGGEAIAISGCDDDQNSTGTTTLAKFIATGAMTFCFIQAIERSSAQGITYGSIMNSMRNTLKNTKSNDGGGLVTTMLGMIGLGGSGFKQEPQLTASEPFDVYEKPFTL